MGIIRKSTSTVCANSTSSSICGSRHQPYHRSGWPPLQNTSSFWLSSTSLMEIKKRAILGFVIAFSKIIFCCLSKIEILWAVCILNNIPLWQYTGCEVCILPEGVCQYIAHVKLSVIPGYILGADMRRKSEWNIMTEAKQRFYHEGCWMVPKHTEPAKIQHFGDTLWSPAEGSA